MASGVFSTAFVGCLRGVSMGLAWRWHGVGVPLAWH